jgi:hypothetical protein
MGFRKLKQQIAQIKPGRCVIRLDSQARVIRRARVAESAQTLETDTPIKPGLSMIRPITQNTLEAVQRFGFERALAQGNTQVEPGGGISRGFLQTLP